MPGFNTRGPVHSSVSSMVALIQQITRNYYCHQELLQLLDDLETKTLILTGIGRGPMPEVVSSESLGRRYYLMGFSYYKGISHKDFSLCIRYFTAAYDRGSWEFAFYIGEQFYHGQGVPVNYKIAFKFYLVGAGEGDAESFTKIGQCLEYGQGTVADADKALAYYRKGSEGASRKGGAIYGYVVFHGKGCRQTLRLGLNS